MFTALNALLTSNPAMRDLMIVMLFMISIGINYKTQEAVSALEAQAMNYPYEVISYGLKDVTSTDEAITMVREWQENKWGAQVGAARVLCSQEDKSKIVSMLGKIEAINFCRVVR